MDLVNRGKIDFEDVIERTQTANFPAGAATVRLAKVREKHPFVTIHIRGKSDIRKLLMLFLTVNCIIMLTKMISTKSFT